MSTPVRGLRRVPFAPSPVGGGAGVRAGVRGSALPPSPYTPFSGRRASTTPSSAAVAPTAPAAQPASYAPLQSAATRAAAGTAVSYARPESADAFARGGAEASLRTACLDVVTAVSDAHGFAQEIAAAVDVQVSFADELQNDRTAHPHARREVRLVGEALRLERDTWALIQAAWRSVDMRGRDLCSRRAALRFEDEPSREGMPGIEMTRRVLEWLETVASEELDASGGARVKPLDDPAYRWQYTCSRVAAQPSVDFPLRGQGAAAGVNPLEEVEHKAEQRLARELFRLVRAGRAEEAEQICRHVGQPWRAAVLAGGQRASELSAAGKKGGARQLWRRAAKALATSSVATIPPHERAICGVLSGVLEPALSVAECHEDRVWARLSILLDRAIERSLVSNAGSEAELSGSASQGTMEDADAIMGDGGDALNVPSPTKSLSSGDITCEQVLEAFRESQSLRDTSEVLPVHVLVRIRAVRSYLALGPGIPDPLVVDLLTELACLGREARDESLEWACRFAAHVAVFVKRIGLVKSPEAVSAFENVIVSYARLAIDKELSAVAAQDQGNALAPVHTVVYGLVAQHLAELENIDNLVAVYTQVMASALHGDLRQEWLIIGTRQGAEVRQIHDRRNACLVQAGKCFGRHGRDALNRITVAAVDLVWSQHLPDHPSLGTTASSSGLGVDNGDEATKISAEIPTEYNEISHDDEMVVRVIEYLMFPGFGNYEEALRRVTTAARRFFLLGKRAAARHVVEWFPGDALAQIPNGHCDNELHELDSWRAYMTAVTRHNEWRTYFFSQRPLPLPANVMSDAVANPGQVSYEVQAAANLKMEAYAKNMANYNRLAASTREVAIGALRAAVKFDGGWMRDTSNEDTGRSAAERDRRFREMVAIRKVAVPQLVALFHHVLHESGLFADAVELATMIADDGGCLYEDFEPVELAAFLQKIAHSAVLYADSSIKGDGSRDGDAHPYVGHLFEEIAIDAED